MSYRILHLPFSILVAHFFFWGQVHLRNGSESEFQLASTGTNIEADIKSVINHFNTSLYMRLVLYTVVTQVTSVDKKIQT